MPDINFDPFEDGTDLTADNLNTRLNSVTTTINDLTGDAPQRGAFNENHLPSLVIDQQYENLPGDVNPGAGDYTNTAFAAVEDAGTPLQVDFASPIDLGDEDIGGIFVRASLTLNTMAGGVPTDTDMLFRIEFFETGGAWQSITRTERLVWSRGGSTPLLNVRIDVPIATLIKASDLTAPGQTIDSVRVVTRVNNAAVKSTLRNCQLLALVLHSNLD